MPPPRAGFERQPVIAVLYTLGDIALQWLHAGQALQRLLLTATVRGVAATPMTQPVELVEFRHRLTDPTNGRTQAQMVLRLGYGPRTPATPRRPLEDTLTSL